MGVLTAKPVIYDGDMGGDDIWGIMATLAHPESFDVKGITTVFGNVNCNNATQNILDVLSHYKHGHIPVYKGANRPLRGDPMFGDGAYGDNGIGGVVLKGDETLQAREGAAQFIIDTVMNSPRPVTIFGTGPSTNIATALQASPEIKGNISSIILMGGGLVPGPHPDIPGRSGNITMYSEFNFFQDPYSANVIFNSGVDVHVMTMDATQRTHLDPAKRDRIRSISDFNLGSTAYDMLAPAGVLDHSKFGTDGPFMHDPNVVIYALNADLYSANRANVHLTEHPDEDVPMAKMHHGQMHVIWNKAANVTVVHDMNRPEGVFDTMLRSLQGFASRSLEL